MASFTGAQVNDMAYGYSGAVRALAAATTLNSSVVEPDVPKICGWVYAMTDRDDVSFSCVKAHDYLYDQILNRIWLSPSRISAGFITEDTVYDILIWNAFRDHVVHVSGVNPSDHPGLLFPVTFPKNILSMQERHWPLTLTETGPFVVDMIFSVVMDDVAYPIHITCIRAILMLLEPDWSDGILFSLTFDTVISTGRTLLEQRRPLIPVPSRELSVSYVAEGLDDQILLNKVCWCHDKMVGVPLYHEPFYVDDVTADSVVLSAVTDISGYFNLNRLARYVLVMNRVTGLYGLFEIESISGSDVTLTMPVGDLYPSGETVVYPVLFAMIASADFGSLTPVARSARITFKEFEYGE